MCLLVESETELVKSPVPDTRDSLILRLPDRRDVEAWDEFALIYQPLVYRLARAKGLQDADAQEIVQEVLVAVSRAVDAHLSGRAALGWELWGLMVLVAWHERRVASPPALPDATGLQPAQLVIDGFTN